jgi:hypothetical protein
VGDIIQESRATSSHYTRATSSESARRNDYATEGLATTAENWSFAFDNLLHKISGVGSGCTPNLIQQSTCRRDRIERVRFHDQCICERPNIFWSEAVHVAARAIHANESRHQTDVNDTIEQWSGDIEQLGCTVSIYKLEKSPSN